MNLRLSANGRSTRIDHQQENQIMRISQKASTALLRPQLTHEKAIKQQTNK